MYLFLFIYPIYCDTVENIFHNSLNFVQLVLNSTTRGLKARLAALDYLVNQESKEVPGKMATQAPWVMSELQVKPEAWDSLALMALWVPQVWRVNKENLEAS